MNTSEPLLGLLQARQRVLEIQTKLHRWANDDPHRRFDDLFNLVTDRWSRCSAQRVDHNHYYRHIKCVAGQFNTRSTLDPIRHHVLSSRSAGTTKVIRER